MISAVSFSCIMWFNGAQRHQCDFHRAFATFGTPLQTHSGQHIIRYKVRHLYNVMILGLDFSLDFYLWVSGGEERGMLSTKDFLLLVVHEQVMGHTGS